MSVLLKLLIVWVVVGLAPVPADPPPDPLGWGYLGVRLSPPGGAIPGVCVLSEVVPHGPAAQAGLRVGDELVRIGGRRPASQLDAIRAIADLRPGTIVRMEVRRNSRAEVILVRLGARPEVDERGDRLPSPFSDR
jgi:S1-C subfamily serine protease